MKYILKVETFLDQVGDRNITNYGFIDAPPPQVQAQRPGPQQPTKQQQQQLQQQQMQLQQQPKSILSTGKDKKQQQHHKDEGEEKNMDMQKMSLKEYLHVEFSAVRSFPENLASGKNPVFFFFDDFIICVQLS